MYLRKSRMDTDYENASVAETLSRHRTILENLCKAKRLHVVEVLEEVVSGESLYARPKMMRLLELINTGMYAGVVCMDIERLSRGSSLESGHIMQVLQVNSCKIITPGKTYDLQNDSDEQFTDMKFMFSRYELKTINKRLVRGRNQSASEGKFMGSMAPYGYLHDIGNLVNRKDHSQSGAVMAWSILNDMGCDPGEMATIVTAIGNHDEGTGVPVNAVAAAMFLADKADVRRSRVRNKDLSTFDIHDRVNYSVKKSALKINEDKTLVKLKLTVDTKYGSVMEYFEIFMQRMILCRKAAEKLGLQFKLIINEQQLI